MIKKITYILLLFIWTTSISLSAQGISGFVMNSDNQPIPYVNVFVKEIQEGTATNENGQYYLTLAPGNYQIVFSAIGYESLTLQLLIGDEPIQKNVYLEANTVALDELVVKASKRDPAYRIIKKAIENKKRFRTPLDSFRCQVYVKATEKITERKKQQEPENEDYYDNNGSPMESMKIENTDSLLGINMVEMQLALSFLAPNKYKEERSAYKKYGEESGLYLPLFEQVDFNFYDNLVFPKDLVDVPLISPLNNNSILTYKFKLEETILEGEELVYKIKITPRKTGNASLRGYIFINKSLHNINRLELMVDKGNLKFYDKLTISQTYKALNDSTWLPVRQEFDYETRKGRKQKFEGGTVLLFSEFNTKPTFERKFFGSEIAVTAKEAYLKDSTFWNTARPEPLSFDQQKMVREQDSLETLYNSTEYQDSVQEAYNKVQFVEVLYDGLGFRNYKKKQTIFIGPLLSIIGYDIVTGFRIGPFFGYSRRFEDGRYVNSFSRVTWGLQTPTIQGTSSLEYRYDPYRLSEIGLAIGRITEPINSYDAIVNLINPNNYYMNNFIGLSHRFEILNGLYLDVRGTFYNRQSVKDLKVSSFLDDIFINETPLNFETYQAFITSTVLEYTPFQRYITEPTGKVVLGSRYPTFSIELKTAWDKFLGSDVRFDYLEFKMRQDLTLGVLGTSKYLIKSGQFINTDDLRFIDSKWFRRSDRWLFSNPLLSFQLLDQAIATENLFVEMHYIHHFNGLFINTLPIIKKTKLRVVAGAGFLWLQNENFTQQEAFAGLERIFKIGPRRRLRLGVYGVVGSSNQTTLQTEYKFSIDVIDTWNRSWEY